jgi:hypothetical protein
VLQPLLQSYTSSEDYEPLREAAAYVHQVKPFSTRVRRKKVLLLMTQQYIRVKYLHYNNSPTLGGDDRACGRHVFTLLCGERAIRGTYTL